MSKKSLAVSPALAHELMVDTSTGTNLDGLVATNRTPVVPVHPVSCLSLKTWKLVRPGALPTCTKSISWVTHVMSWWIGHVTRMICSKKIFRLKMNRFSWATLLFLTIKMNIRESWTRFPRSWTWVMQITALLPVLITLKTSTNRMTRTPKITIRAIATWIYRHVTIRLEIWIFSVRCPDPEPRPKFHISTTVHVGRHCRTCTDVAHVEWPVAGSCRLPLSSSDQPIKTFWCNLVETSRRFNVFNNSAKTSIHVFQIGNWNVILCQLIHLLIKCFVRFRGLGLPLFVCRYERKHWGTKISVLVSCK